MSTASSDSSVAAVLATPVAVPAAVRGSPVNVGDMVLTIWKCDAGGPNYALPGTVMNVDMKEQRFEVLTYIDDRNLEFEFPTDFYPFEQTGDD
jgi:hypothetical protein